MKTYNHKGSKILVVDDDTTNLKYLLIRLTQAGFEVIQALSASEALDHLTKISPDLILLDIKMPVMDGFELCDRLKAMEKTAEVPVIFLTALTDTVDKVKGFESGGVDYVTKPINFDELLARVNAHLTLRRQHLELKESEAKFQILADFSYDFEYWINNEGHFVYVSPSAERITGYSAAEFEEDPSLLKRIIHPEDRQRIWQDIENGFSQNYPLITNFKILTKSGEIRWLAHKSQPVLDKEGKNYGRRASNQDITTLKVIEDALRRSEQQLKEANHSKDKFFTILAHDLRSPFTGLLGLAEMMYNYHNELTSEEFREFSIGIYESAKVIYNLIENLLVWSRLQSGKMDFKSEKVNLFETTKSVVNLFETNALKKNLTINNDVYDDIFVVVDKNMIEMILRNLISNAIKFSNYAGVITINTELTESIVKINIVDNGVGISEESLPKLFRIDQIVTTEGTNKEQGTGLGLILAKDFVEVNKGKIGAISKEGEGSTFFFTLPLANDI